MHKTEPKTVSRDRSKLFLISSMETFEFESLTL